MPFQSEAQRKYLFMKHPKVAEEFAAHTPHDKELPEHKKPLKKRVKDTWHGDKWKDEEKKKVDKK